MAVGISVQLLVETTSEPIRGWIEPADGPRRPFTGWLELTALLADAIAAAPEPSKTAR
jgi:hypothetical protein